MQGKERKIEMFIGFVLLLQACNMLEPKGKRTSSTTESVATVKPVRPLPVCGVSEVKDTTMLLMDSAIEKTFRHLNAADEQYLKLAIPDYSEIDLFYENSQEALAYSAELKRYFIARKCDIHRHETRQPTSGELKEKRFYIKHIGDNRYFIYIYSEYTQEDHINL